MKSSVPLANDENISQHFREAGDRIIRFAIERKYCAIIGPRYSGKTNLLKCVREELENRSRVVVQVNLHDALATKPSDFLNSLATIISQQLVNQSRVSEIIAVSVSDSSTFRSFIQDVIDQLNDELFLIIDHLEGVSNDLVRLLLTSLRAIYMEQQSNSEHRLVAIVAGALSLAGVATGETSPFRGIAELVIVDLPPDEESERYITTFFFNLNVRLSSATLKYLIRATRGDRHLFKILCDKCAQSISEKNPKKLSVPLVERISQEFILTQMQSHTPLQEAVRLIENNPDLLVCTLLLIKKGKVNRQQLPLPLSPDFDPFYLTGFVRKVGSDGYQFRNEIYRRFIAYYFNPGRVGRLLLMSGRWDQAIDYLEKSSVEGNDQYHSDLLDATINAMYAADDVNLAAHYVVRGLLAVFNVERVQIFYSLPEKNVLKLIVQAGKEAKIKPAVGDEILISDDRLESRVYREMYPLREQENDECDNLVLPLLVSEHRAIGVVSICDFANGKNTTKQREKELQLIGYLNRAARAIHYVKSRREDEARRVELAETLREVAVLISGSLELHEVLRQILEQMRRVLPFNMASVQLLNTEGNALNIISSQGFDDPISVDKLSFPLDGTYPNVKVWHQRLPIRYADVREYFPHFANSKYHATRIRGWLGVPLLIGEKVIGVITLDSFTTNSYTLEHEHLSMVFAGQAAVAIENARLFEQTRQRGEQLTAMDQIVLHIAKRLEVKELLRDIVRRATELIKGAGGGVYMWDETVQSFRLESVYGLDSSLEGSQTEKEQGVVWEVLRSKKTFAVTDYPNWPNRLRLFDQDNLTAVVCAPIILGDRFLGAIVVHDTVQGRVFGEAEKDLLHRFGNHVAVALENARAYKAEHEAKDYQERLISSSLDGIIAVDDHGWVNVYNKGAERICGFLPGEVLNRGKWVGDLYGDLVTAEYIKQKVNAEGKLENYETRIKNNEGKMIPILISATVLEDSNGNSVGSIGYFKDLRPLKKVEGELRSVLDAISAVANASELDNGLTALVEKMAMGLNVSFCLILLLYEEKQDLKVRAAYPVQRSDPLVWDPRIGDTLDLKGFPIIAYLSKIEKPRAFRRRKTANTENIILDFIQETTALGSELQSILTIPFRTEQGLFGVCILGETRNWERNPFDENKKKSAVSMSDAVTVLIDRLRAQETLRRRMTLAEELRKVSDAVAQLTTEAPKVVLDKIAQGVSKMVDAECVMIYPYHADLEIYDVRNIGTYGLRDEEKRFKPKPRMHPKSMTRVVLRSNTPVIVDNTETGVDRGGRVKIWAGENKFLKREWIKSFVGTGLWSGQEAVGTLFVNFRSHHQVTDDELNTIKIFANQAAVAIQQSRLYQRGEKDHKVVLSTNKITQLIGSAEALHEVWQTILEGAMDVTDAKRGRILSMDRFGNLTTEVSLGFDKKSNTRFQDRLYGPCPLVKRVMDNKKSLLISDMADDSHPKSLREDCIKFYPDANSILAAPVLHNDAQNVLGVLVLESADWAAFSAYDKILMEAFIKYAGIAVQSAERIAEIQRGAGFRTELLKAGQSIISLEKSQEVLQSIANRTKIALGCDLVTLYTYDESRQEIGFPSTNSGELENPPALQTLGYVSKQSVVWKILRTGEPYFAVDSLHDIHMLSNATARQKGFKSFVEREGICSSAGLPLLVGNERVGILFVNYRTPHSFPEDKRENIRLFATQAAIAIHNARLYEDIQKREMQLKALYDAAKVITQKAGLDGKQLLDKILELAITITGTIGEKAILGTIQIVDEQANEREFTNVYPPSEYPNLQAQIGLKLSLDKTKTKNGKVGVTGRAAITGKPQLVHNVKEDFDYIMYLPEVKSELAVPILINGDRVIGVINVESDIVSAFDISDRDSLVALADLVAIAIQKVQSQEEFNAIQTVNSTFWLLSRWAHKVRQKSFALGKDLNTLKKDLPIGLFSEILNNMDESINQLSIPAQTIFAEVEETREQPVDFGKLLATMADRLHRKKKVPIDLDLSIDNQCLVMGNQLFLEFAIECLLENAIRSIEQKEKPGKLEVGCRLLGDFVQASISDTGMGIDQDASKVLFHTPVDSVRGLGYGTYTTANILRAYKGGVRVAQTNSEGTRIELWLPVIKA